MTPDDVTVLGMRVLSGMTSIVRMHGRVEYTDRGWRCEADGPADTTYFADTTRSDIVGLLDVIESVIDSWSAAVRSAPQ